MALFFRFDGRDVRRVITPIVRARRSVLRAGGRAHRGDLRQRRRRRCSGCSRAAGRFRAELQRIGARACRRAIEAAARRHHSRRGARCTARDGSTSSAERILEKRAHCSASTSSTSCSWIADATDLDLRVHERSGARLPARAQAHRRRTVRLGPRARAAGAGRGLEPGARGAAPGRGADRQGDRLADRGAAGRRRQVDRTAERAAHRRGHLRRGRPAT